MQIVKTVAIAGKVSQDKWNLVTKNFHKFCESEGIVIIRERVDDKGDDRFLELALQENDAKKVRDYIGRMLLNQI